ncbi:MAG: hypothetical protein JHC61_00105 [Burkholderiaceae bacterium]|nr:hypothetical protein [Burkholderiaceae bacterium]
MEINKGFDIEGAHRAIARIEHVQGWQREQNGRYQMLENGELGREPIDLSRLRRPDQRKQDMENCTGEKSAERIAIEDGAPVIKRAQTWAQLHRELAEQGMRYEKTGSGATLFAGAVGVKASSADREASLGKLQKRLGAYQPSTQRQQVAPREPEPIKADVPGWKDYIIGRKAHYAEKNAAKLLQDTRQAQERQALAARQKLRRVELLQGKWKGKGEVLNALRSVIAAEQAAEKADLKERHQQEKAEHRQRFWPYPSLEQWRYRSSEPQCIEGDRLDPPRLRDIRAYQAEIVGQQVHYTRKGAAGADCGVSFVDKGKSIDIYSWRNQGTTLAALQLSAQKWNSFTVTGNNEYKALCVELAAEHGFKITNPELQESIQQKRQAIRESRAQAVKSEPRKSEPLKQFERYAEAVGAERYRVTSLKVREDGSTQTFVLGKKDGITEGLTPSEIAQRMPEMQRLQGRGENLYYTPLSDNKHHIVIDDMSQEKLEQLSRDGYQPAAVLESSPGHYQALITVQKLGTPHDKDVGKDLSDAVNRKYGNPKLSSGIHPHPAPGYENLNRKHQREEGSYPKVRLLRAERRECVQAQALSRQIDADYQQEAVLKAPQSELAKPALALTAVSGNAINAYQRHYRDVLDRQRGGEVDLSRVDSMIAVRMRVTGHDQTAIEGAIRQCAPATRQKGEGRDWSGYAQRTARYAYSAAGERQAVELAKYRQQWEKLEGREPIRQLEQTKALKIERNNSLGRSR